MMSSNLPARRIEAMSFDATGTLFHAPDLFAIYAEVLGRHGQTASPEEIERLFPVVFKELDCLTPTGGDRFAHHPDGARGWWSWFLQRLCQLLEIDPPSPFAAAELFERFAEGRSWQVYPEVPEVLEALRARGFRAVVLSNWDSRLRRLLSELGLSDYFESVFLSAELGIAKPNPALFLQVVHDLNLAQASALLHIGNNQSEDGEGAAAAGVRFSVLDRRMGDDLSKVLAIL